MSSPEAVSAELVPVDTDVAEANEAGARWFAELQLVRSWLKEVHDKTRKTYAQAIGWPYALDEQVTTTTFQPEVAAQYRGGVTWLTWCAANGVHLLDARRADVVTWAETLRSAVSFKTQQPLSPGTISYTFVAASALYTWLMQAGHIEVSPFVQVSRKGLGVTQPDKSVSPTRSLSIEEAGALLAAADDDPVVAVRARSSALVAFLLDEGTRVEEALTLRLTKMGYNNGVRYIEVTLKGGRQHQIALAPQVAKRIDAYLETRGIGSAVALRKAAAGVPPLLFATASGRRVEQKEVRVLLERLSRQAGISEPHKVTPHVLRHTHISVGRLEGVDGATLQRHIGHKDGSTTDRYGIHTQNLAQSPALVIASAIEAAAERHRAG